MLRCRDEPTNWYPIARYRAAVCGAESWPEPMPDTGKDGAQRIKLSELAQKGFVRRGDCLVLWRPNPDSNGEYAEPFVAVVSSPFLPLYGP